jgi:hypothetical protein
MIRTNIPGCPLALVEVFDNEGTSVPDQLLNASLEALQCGPPRRNHAEANRPTSPALFYYFMASSLTQNSWLWKAVPSFAASIARILSAFLRLPHRTFERPAGLT